MSFVLSSRLGCSKKRGVMRVTNLPTRIQRLTEGSSFYLLLVLIILGGLVLRTLFLSADPPIGITNSQDFSTDPFSYLYFAKNEVDQGDANPYNDDRWILYEKSTQTLAGLLVYSVLGTGRAEGNFVGVLLNMLAILMLALGIKNFGSRLGAILAALLACLNYTMIHFARAPFLEASQNFWLCAAFFLFSLGQRKLLFYACAGAAAAAAALFGKMVALFAIGLYFAAFLFYWLAQRDRFKEILRQAILFYAGYLIVGIFWFLFTYLPSPDQVAHYLGEQGVGLYGAPRALDGIGMFFWQMLTLLVERNFFAKLPLITIMGTLFGGLVICSLAGNKRAGAAGDRNIGWLILLFWAAAGFVALFPFNYRPLRYQTTLMFPLMAMAGLMLARLFNPAARHKQKGKAEQGKPNPVVAGLVLGLWLMPLLFALVVVPTGEWSQSASRSSLLDNIMVYVIVFLVIGIGIAFLCRHLSNIGDRLRIASAILAALLVVGYCTINIVNYTQWVTERQYTLDVADRDLGAILADNAVISGSYATALTQENGLGCVHHMFGLKYVDPDYFNRFPITHLVIDEGNEQRARQDYPEVMSQAQLLATYGIRGYPIKLFRVAGATANSQASSYQPTEFEIARYWIDRQNSDSARACFERYLELGIPNYSADMALGTAYERENNHIKALEHLRKAVKFAPRDVLASYYLGNAYLGATAVTTDPAYFDSALVYLKYAQRFMPNDARLALNVEQLERRK